MMLEWKSEHEAAFSDAGRLLLRLTIGGLMLFHGIEKLSVGVGGISGMLETKGLPTFLAYGVFVGEVVTPVLMVIGLYTRIASIVFAFNMLVAIGLAHSGEVFALGPHGGWAIELPLLFLLGSVCIALLGPGRYAVGSTTGWRA